ncbi:hypothetical protein G4D62_10850 [Bacillus shackletonii]|uniref:hypothetical protein n=1 Tax=Heyndrickxia shackletonii TaxID=157838 RepID=UPI00128EC81A|nr:hypothetical protein [Heyndrickxia shackletonii]NEY99800.1 hypothetical protein [Heyndrickxia shackletonii]
MFLLFLISGISSNQVLINAESKTIVAKSEEAKVVLYAVKSDGMYRNFEMKINKGMRFFPFWLNVTNPTYAPEILYKDINRDGIKDLIIVLTRGYGTGARDSEVHVFHKIRTNIGEVDKENLVDNPTAIILKNVKTSLSKHQAIVRIGNRKTIINIDSLHIPQEHLFSDIALGNIKHYDVINDHLVASVSAQISPTTFIGMLEITYEFKDKMYQAKKIEFKRVK